MSLREIVKDTLLEVEGEFREVLEEVAQGGFGNELAREMEGLKTRLARATERLESDRITDAQLAELKSRLENLRPLLDDVRRATRDQEQRAESRVSERWLRLLEASADLPGDPTTPPRKGRTKGSSGSEQA